MDQYSPGPDVLTLLIDTPFLVIMQKEPNSRHEPPDLQTGLMNPYGMSSHKRISV